MADGQAPRGPRGYDPTKDPNLGSLSEYYEAGDRGSAAIGHDRTGGWSYGKYQIATHTGTMKSFLDYTKHHDPNLYQALEDAGGAKGAAAHSADFVKAWDKAAADGSLKPLEHGFVRDTHFTPQRETLQAAGLDLSKRDRALSDAVWSTAVQHGPKTHVVTTALDHVVAAEQAKDAKAGAHRGRREIIDGIDDKRLIEAIYDERGATTTVGHQTHLKYFHGSTKAVQDSVAHRFHGERAVAVGRVGQDPEHYAAIAAGHHEAAGPRNHHASGGSHHADGHHAHAQAHAARPPEQVVTGVVLTRHHPGQGAGEDPFAAYAPPPAAEITGAGMPSQAVSDPASAPARQSESARDWSALAGQAAPEDAGNSGGAAIPGDRRQSSAAYWQSKASGAAASETAREGRAEPRESAPNMER